MTTIDLRALLGDRYDDVIERATRALSERWNSMHTNESRGRQRMLAGFTIAAVLPDLLAVAWDEGVEAMTQAVEHAREGRRAEARSAIAANPYRTTATAAYCDRGPCHLPGGHGGPCNPGGDANTDERNER